MHLAVLPFDTEETGFPHILLFTVHFLTDGESHRGNPSFQHLTHAVVIKQELLVNSQCGEFFPRKLVFVKLIPTGKFGDTSFIVEFAVLHQFFAFHSGVFPFSDLDYGIQCLFQKDKRYEEETETRGIFVLVLEIGEE